METLEEYIAEAKKRTGVSSHRKLCALLEIAPNSITNYFNKGVYPNDKTMLKIAKLAGVNDTKALLDVNIWRSSGRCKALYSKMAEIIKQSGATLAVFLLSAVPALASSGLSDIADFIYYVN